MVGMVKSFQIIHRGVRTHGTMLVSTSSLCRHTSPYSNQTSTQRSFSSKKKDGKYDKRPDFDAVVPVHVEEPVEVYTGFDLVLQRSSNILINVCDKAYTSVLQTHCNSRIIEFLKEKPNFSLTGCSESAEDIEIASQSMSNKGVKQYLQLDLVDHGKDLPFRRNSLGFIINLRPIDCVPGSGMFVLFVYIYTYIYIYIYMYIYKYICIYICIHI
jgi:hypothetical protein